MQGKKRALAILSTAALTIGLVVATEAPAFAATCSASVTFGTSGSTASATEYNGSTPGTACALVQVKIIADQGGGATMTYTGSMSASSSYATGYSIGSAWWGRAKPSTSWSEKRWYSTGSTMSFAG